MNTIIYEINEKKLVGENDEKYTAYGVDCFEDENGFKSLVTQIIDISPNLSKVQSFVDMLNTSNLSHTQLYDAVNDFICSEN